MTVTAQIPIVFALLGTALMALAIFAPERARPVATVSFAPPTDPFTSAPAESFTSAAAEPFAPATADSFAPGAVASSEPGWPGLVDPRAAGCDAVARLALVDALAAVRAPWAEAILQRANGDEPDPLVRAAIRTALVA